MIFWVNVLVKLKIAVIGAGSTSFSLGIVRDVCLTEGLADSKVSLMDIDEKRLEDIYGLARRYAEELKREIDLERTIDRREALRDADFVINTALVVSHDKEEIQWRIARKYGYRRGYFMNSLAGDEALFTTFYQWKLIRSIIRDMEEVCPDAWYIQSANPQFIGISGRTHCDSRVKRAGLCHGIDGVRGIAKMLGLDWKYVSAQAPGMNHFIWMTHFLYKGEDAYPLLDEWIENEAQKFWDSPQCGDIGHPMGPKAVDLYRTFGLFPIGDTCTAGGGSWPWWYHTDDATEKRWKENPDAWYDRYHKNKKKQIEEVSRVVANPSASVTSFLPPVKSSESSVAIIDALANDREHVLQVNIPNRGVIPSLPDDVVVEIPAIASGRGIQGIHVGDLPKALMIQMRRRLDALELELEAYIAGDKNRLIELVLMEPWSKSMDQVKGVLDEIMALPFNSEMGEHFKWFGN